MRESEVGTDVLLMLIANNLQDVRGIELCSHLVCMAMQAEVDVDQGLQDVRARVVDEDMHLCLPHKPHSRRRIDLSGSQSECMVLMRC